jgi:hypothetical protein
VPPHLFNVLDVLALLLGIFFSVRRGWTRARSGQEQPQVEPEAFARWQKQELAALNLVITASFLKVLAAPGWLLLCGRLGVDLSLMRRGSAAIDLAWLAVVLVGMWRRRANRRLADEVGIDQAAWSA